MATEAIGAIGVTGTHVGCTSAQHTTLRLFITALNARSLHHGDCVGVDAEAAGIANLAGMRVICHPPLNEIRRAFAPSHEVRIAKHYLVRDRDIVDESDLMIGVPRLAQEELRSGTWATIRYAVKQNRTVYLINPDGTLYLYWGTP